MRQLSILLLLLCCYGQSHATYQDWWQKVFFGPSYHACKAYKDQNFDQALIDLHDAMNKDPYNPEYNYNVGTVLYRQEKYADACQAFTRAINNAKVSLPLQEQAYFNAGNCWYKLEKWQNAVDAYQQVLNINKHNQAAEHNLQLALYKLKEQDMKNQAQDHQQNKDQSTQDQKQCDGSNQHNKQGDQETEQNNNSGSKNDAEHGSSNKHKQQGENKQDQHNQSNEKDGERDHEQSDDDGNVEQKNDNGYHRKQGEQPDHKDIEGQDSLSDNMSQQDIDQKNEKALQDLHEKVDQIDRVNHTEVENQKDTTQMPDLSSHQDHKKSISPFYKKPELKNNFQEQYENKASDDDRLTDYHASLMKTLEELEEKIQKHVIKNKVAMQGAGHHGKKGW